MTNPKFFIVGGFVRDFYINQIHNTNIYSKDVDIVLECNSIEELQDEIMSFDSNADIRVIDATFGRILAGVDLEKFNWLAKNYSSGRGKRPTTIYVDFIIAREEGDYRDGQHPSFLRFSSIESDLQRRDFTINSIAINDQTEEVLDLFNGREDITRKRIVTIRDCYSTFSEHGMRILRALRISVEKQMNIDRSIWLDLTDHSEEYASLLSKPIFQDSIRTELTRMLKFDTVQALQLINTLPFSIKKAIFTENWLMATNKCR